MKRVLLSLVVVLTTTVHCQDSTTDVSSTTPLDCGYLANSYKISVYSYDGQCCNPKAVAYMDQEYGSNWRENSANPESSITALYRRGYCVVSTSSTTAAISSTTELKSSTTDSPTTTAEGFNCYWLNRTYSNQGRIVYNGECCNAESVDYLNKNYVGLWTTTYSSYYTSALRNEGVCPRSTTSTVSSTSSTTTTTTTSEFESTGLKSTTEAETSSESGECIFSVLSNTLNCLYYPNR
ncbi:unnamed protein product [Caenorhabditis nigoni]